MLFASPVGSLVGSRVSATLETPLGGFFGIDLPDVVPDVGGLAAVWEVAETRHAWTNATSALASLVAHLRPGSVWLPGYICSSVLAAVPREVQRFFPLREDLSPETDAMEGRLSHGDMVLAVDMFGRAPGPDWHAFVAAHSDVTFVEDCAQALDTGTAAWGDWRLYSPRKLVGVPEGGLLAPVSQRAQAQAADLPGPIEGADPSEIIRRLAPALARLERPDANDLWHPMHQSSEADAAVTAHGMSKFARGLLAALDPKPLAETRRRNFRQLAAPLEPYAVLPEADPCFAPFGFPVALPPDLRERVRDRLHASRIFPAIHWNDIAAPSEFTADYLRARSLLTLPCDHRYGPNDMERLATTFLESLT